MESQFYTKENALVNTRNIWHYLIDTPIGDIHVVQFEKENMAIDSKMFSMTVKKQKRISNPAFAGWLSKGDRNDKRRLSVFERQS